MSFQLTLPILQISMISPKKCIIKCVECLIGGENVERPSDKGTKCYKCSLWHLFTQLIRVKDQQKMGQILNIEP